MLFQLLCLLIRQFNRFHISYMIQRVIKTVFYNQVSRGSGWDYWTGDEETAIEIAN